MSTTLHIRLPEDLALWLEKESLLAGVSKSRMVREILEISRTRPNRQAFLDSPAASTARPA